jgi:hypothetical protein
LRRSRECSRRSARPLRLRPSSPEPRLTRGWRSWRGCHGRRARWRRQCLRQWLSGCDQWLRPLRTSTRNAVELALRPIRQRGGDLRLCGLLGRKLPRSRSRSAWRSPRTWLRCRGEGQTGAIFALCALRSFTAGRVCRTISPGREVGKGRRQRRSNTGIRPGQLPACTGVPLIIMAERRLERPRVSPALSDRKGVPPPCR